MDHIPSQPFVPHFYFHIITDIFMFGWLREMSKGKKQLKSEMRTKEEQMSSSHTHTQTHTPHMHTHSQIHKYIHTYTHNQGLSFYNEYIHSIVT